jgi:hypothetical protein
VTLSDWVSRLKNKVSSMLPSFVLTAIIDYCNYIVNVFNDWTENCIFAPLRRHSFWLAAEEVVSDKVDLRD